VWPKREVRRQIGVLGDVQGHVLAGGVDDLEAQDLAGVRPE
jgi:phage FluMu protein gp41